MGLSQPGSAQANAIARRDQLGWAVMKILVVEDDLLQSAALVRILATQPYTLEVVRDGVAGLDLARRVAYDLILLDVELPRLDGLRLCQQLRSQGYQQPIVLMTAQADDAAVVAGLEAGADDYITKPWVPEVLLARVRTWLRRSAAQTAAAVAPPPPPQLTWGDLGLDAGAGRVTIAGQPVTLTATEYNLLELFLRHPDRIFSRSAILDQLWEFDEAPTDRAIVTHVKDVRKKLKAGGLSTEIIETVYGMGYRLKPPPALPPAAEVGELERRGSAFPPVAAILARCRPILAAQVAVLVEAQAALLAGELTPALHQAARQDAHKLAGSLASVGYPAGSRWARSLEYLLQAELPYTAAAIVQMSEAVTALQQELAQAPMPSPSQPLGSDLGATVLVIDDDMALTTQLTVAAAAWGVQLHTATTIAAARAQLAQAVPAVILLDLSFPAVAEDGLVLLQEITLQWPQLPVIVLTGRDSLSDRLAVSRLGARQFLPKPASVGQIFQTIARVLMPPPASTMKVLIVDDDFTLLALLSDMLTPWGVVVATLSDPRQFWQTLVAVAPNLILLDLEMPGITGLELCQVVRQDAVWGDIPILVVTAHTDAAALQQAFAAGADDFIAKPVLGPELVTRVLSRMERPRSR